MENEAKASKVLKSFPGSTFKYMHSPPPGANCPNCVELGYYCGKSRLCDVCWTTVTGPVYHSSNNDVDVHPECAKLQPWIRLGDSVFGMRKGSSATNCDWCKRKALDGHTQRMQGFFYVSTCGKHSYHVNCLVDMKNEVMTSKVLNSFPDSTFKYMHLPPPGANCPNCVELGYYCGRSRVCDVCWTMVTGPVYHSSNNDVDVHPECAKLQPWIRLGDSVFGMRKDNSATNCDWCKRKALNGDTQHVRGFFYVSTCGKHSYHVNCLMDMKNEVMASKVLNSFPDSTFKYMHHPPPGANCPNCVELGYYCGKSRVCDVCWTTVTGPVYHSSKNDVDVHPDCAKLQPWIRLGDSVFGMRKDNSATNCDWCKRKALDGHIQRVQGFSYVSTCGKHSYHVNCLMDIKNEVMASKVLNSFSDSTFKYMHRPPSVANCPNCVEMGYYCGRSRLCDVCWTTVTGPVYHSSNNDVDVHPECTKLQPWIRLGNSVFGLRKESSAANCDWCKRKTLDGHIQRVQGFCYVSTCGNHSYHVNCLMDMNTASSSMPAVQKLTLHRSGGDRTRLIRIMVTIPFMFLKIAISFVSGDPTSIFITLGVQLYKMWRIIMENRTQKIKSH